MTFASKRDQRQRIEDVCAREGLELVEMLEEDDVSGGAPLSQRPGLGKGLAMVESGEAEVVVVAYFDRLVRSLPRQAEILERVEQAGGRILSVDVGEVRADTASRWLTSTMLGLVAEYHRRATAERTAEAKQSAVGRGVPPFPNVPPGYRRRTDGTLEPDPTLAPIVSEAFKLRAAGKPIREIRAYLQKHGIRRSYHGVQALLSSRIVLGELRFGNLVNTDSHPPIVDRAVWEAAQRSRVSRGRRPQSESLLARLGVLRCGSCRARMVVGTSEGRYRFYRCPPVGDCQRRVTISAGVAEAAVVRAVVETLEHLRGTASAEPGIAEAEQRLEEAERALEAAVYAFDGLGDDVEAARVRLAELRQARDAARETLAGLRARADAAVAVTAHGNWDELTLEERRALIRAVIDRAEVLPASVAVGADRIVIHTR